MHRAFFAEHKEIWVDDMEEKKLCTGLSVTAIILIALSALVMNLNSANGSMYGVEASFYGLPFIAAFAIPLLVILILLSHYIKKTDTMEDMIAAIAVRYVIFGWFFIFVMKFAAAAMYAFCYDFFTEHYSTIYLILNSFNVCVIGTLVLGFALRDIPKVKIEKRKMRVGQLLLLIMMMYGLTQVGSMMGMPIDLALSAFNTDDKSAATDLSTLLFGSNVPVVIICVGILPAIFEELLFRKFLIDRTLRYGEFVSCAMSGIMFGLWHGNFQQFFFTFFIGVMFAFVYIRTGNIIYTMIMHASMNLVTASVTLQLFAKFMEKAGYDPDTGTIRPIEDYDAFMSSVVPIILVIFLWIAILVSFQIVGFIMLIVKRRNFKLVTLAGEPGRKVILHNMTHSIYMWVFFAFAIMLFLNSYLPDILVFFMSRS